MPDERVSSSRTFLDGCHQYGWVLTILINLVLLGYFSGSISQAQQDLKERVVRMEHQLDQLLQRAPQPK